MLMMDAGNSPDIITNVYPGKFVPLAQSELLLATSDYFDQVPNFTTMVDRYNAHDDINILKVTLDDNSRKYFHWPNITDSGIYSEGPVIREDVVKRLGFDLPTSWDELTPILRAYKAENPGSFPVTALYGLDALLFFIAGGWGVDAGWTVGGTHGYFYDNNSQQYEFTLAHPRYKEMLVHLSMLSDEGLLDSEIVTLTFDQWISRMTTGDSIITFCWFDQLDELNVSGQQIVGPEFNLVPILPLAGGSFNQRQRPHSDLLTNGWVMPATVADNPNFDRLMELVNWLYSEEGRTLTTWGIEGKTFEIVDGRKVFTDQILNDPAGIGRALQMNYGLVTNMTLARSLEFDLAVLNNPERSELALEAAAEGVFAPNRPRFSLSPDETDRLGPMIASLLDYAKRAEVMFIFDDSDIEVEWDDFVQQLRDLRMDYIAEIFNANLVR
jgi:putative aldouronate transport system substrate-binding protein